tara:strand:- start:354 stop:806 length:453 start_codon:yes stop_codon:yes gene_type:complete
MGTVYTEDEWDTRMAAHEEQQEHKEHKEQEEEEQQQQQQHEQRSHHDEHFAVVLKDGAHELVLDGGRGASLNALKYLNHSCVPNATMHEMYVGGCWHVLVFALAEIAPGSELTFDYKLSTEDPDDRRLLLQCQCGEGDQCRGTLFALHEW